jgi:hypothetical protein
MLHTAVFVELERSMIREHVVADLERVKKQGVVLAGSRWGEREYDPSSPAVRRTQAQRSHLCSRTQSKGRG